MRRFLSILLCALLVVNVSLVSATSETPTVSCGRVSGNQGEIVDVTVDLANCTGFINIGLEIGYNSEVLTLESVTNGVLGAQITKAQYLTANPYNIIWNATENVNYNGTMATLRFRIANNASAGNYPITVSYYKGRNGNNQDGITVNYDEDLHSLGLAYMAGNVRVGTDDYEEPVVSINGRNGHVGETVDVTVDLANCTGFINIGLEIGYNSEVLTLESVTNGASGAQMTKAQYLTANPYNITWNATENVTYNGTMATLRFRIANDASFGTYPITVSYYKGRNGNNQDGVTINYDEDLHSLGLTYASGQIEVKPYDYVLSANKTESNNKTDITISAFAPSELHGVILVCLYNDSKLQNWKMQEVRENLNVSLDGSGDTVKVMWWDSLNSLRPLCDCVELELHNQ